jgi:hypothetical protein
VKRCQKKDTKFKNVILDPVSYEKLCRLAEVSGRTKRDLLSAIIDKFCSECGKKFESLCEQANSLGFQS